MSGAEGARCAPAQPRFARLRSGAETGALSSKCRAPSPFNFGGRRRPLRSSFTLAALEFAVAGDGRRLVKSRAPKAPVALHTSVFEFLWLSKNVSPQTGWPA